MCEQSVPTYYRDVLRVFKFRTVEKDTMIDYRWQGKAISVTSLFNVLL